MTYLFKMRQTFCIEIISKSLYFYIIVSLKGGDYTKVFIPTLMCR